MVMISEVRDDGTVNGLSGLGLIQRPTINSAKTPEAAQQMLDRSVARPESGFTPAIVQPDLALQEAQAQTQASTGTTSSAIVQSGYPSSMEVSFTDRLMTAVRAQPALFAAGAVGVIAAFIFLPRLYRNFVAPGKSAPKEPVQMLGLGAGPKKKRKSRKKKAAPVAQ